MDNEAFRECLSYINSYWEKIIVKPQRIKLGSQLFHAVKLGIRNTDSSNPHVITVPHAVIFPNNKKFKYIFYWDTFFMFRGVLETKYEWIIPEMVENFVYLFKRYHIIPNFTHPESLGRSQPPFLTSMIFDAYNVLDRDSHLRSRFRKIFVSKRQWLAKHIDVAKKEYNDVWMNASLYNHFVEQFGLNRYGNRDVGYAQPSEQESGWDMTSRFYNRCNQFLPVDLNCFLYVYERDFARAAELLGNKKEQGQWLNVAEYRRTTMQIFWNNTKGFFYDYDYIHKELSEFESLAGFVPMYAEVATADQAALMVKKLPLFETDYGLTITTKESLPPILNLDIFPKPLRYTMEDVLQPKQWDYPNIWPPLEYITVIGLLKYGYNKDATRIMEKALRAHTKTFRTYHALLEKIDGTTGLMPMDYWYPTQTGFGWTNAIFYRYAQILQYLASKPLESSRTHFYPQSLPFSH